MILEKNYFASRRSDASKDFGVKKRKHSKDDKKHSRKVGLSDSDDEE